MEIFRYLDFVDNNNNKYIVKSDMEFKINSLMKRT